MVQFAHINFNNRNFHKNHIFVHTIFTALLNFLLIVRNCRYIYSGYKEISECSSSSEFLNEVSSWSILNEKRLIVVILNFCSSRVTVQLLASCKDQAEQLKILLILPLVVLVKFIQLGLNNLRFIFSLIIILLNMQISNIFEIYYSFIVFIEY